ncbi:hypothetical protein L7F22_021701 [Adiantum nelumboides]|nr:hypothetical protein [Adiantum nelumboides]
MIVRTVNTCLPFVYNTGYLCNDQSQEKGQNIVMKVDPTSQGSLSDLVQWQEVEFPTEWKLDISKTLLNEAQQPMKMSIKRLGLIDQYKLLGKSKSRKDLGLLMQRPQYQETSESVSSSRPSSSRRQARELTLCLHPETYKDIEGLYRCKLCNKLIASDYLQNGVTVLTKEQVAEKELKYSEPYILPPANAKLQPMESASNLHTNALKEIAKLKYSIISRIDAMVKAKQSATPSTSAAPPPTASQQLVPLNYNTSASSSILPHMFWHYSPLLFCLMIFLNPNLLLVQKTLQIPSTLGGEIEVRIFQHHITGMLRYWWDDLNEASKTFILQGGIPENFENVITLFFAAMVIKFLGSQQKIKDVQRSLFQRAEYKQYYVNSFPSSFSNLVKERIKSTGLQIDDQITLAQINAFIDEVTDLECARLHMRKEFKQVKGFNSSFCNKETKSKDFGCAAAEKKCSCKVKNRKNKYGKKYTVARRTRKLSKEERKKIRCYICQKEGHIALECPKRKKRFGNAVLPEKYEYEVVYRNRFEKHDIPISEYMQYESEEDETSDSTYSESPTEAISTFSPTILHESSTTSRSEESEPSWMKKRRPSTLNLSKKNQRDYRPLPLFSNMVEQAKEIAKIEEWRRMIHLGLRQNQGNPPSPVIQQTTSTDFAIPKTSAKSSPSVVEKQLEKERQDRYCAEEHQLKAIQAMFSALEQVNHKIEQLHKLVLNTQSQSVAIEAKVDQRHGKLQYLIDKAAMSKIAKEPVSEWKLQKPVNTCQVISFN